LRPSSFVMCNTPVEVQFTSAGCLNYPCRTPRGRSISLVMLRRLMAAGLVVPGSSQYNSARPPAEGSPPTAWTTVLVSGGNVRVSHSDGKLPPLETNCVADGAVAANRSAVPNSRHGAGNRDFHQFFPVIRLNEAELTSKFSVFSYIPVGL
jgi:hypothetical protein